MQYTLKNDKLVIRLDSFGAQLMNIDSVDGAAFMYDGNPKYWPGRDINIFPYIARLYREEYLLDEHIYRLGIHGFAWQSKFQVVKAEDTYISFLLEDDEKSRKMYPFRFEFYVNYRLHNNQLFIEFKVVNKDTKTIVFGIGGHPAFKVPLDDALKFEDYYLEFDHECIPTQVGMSEDCYVTGNDHIYELAEGRKIPLRHKMFDNDAIILKNIARKVTLKSDYSKSSICVEYPQMSVLGIWHIPKMDAPYICIEPLTSLPGRKGIVENLRYQSDLIHVCENETYINQWSITVNT